MRARFWQEEKRRGREEAVGQKQAEAREASRAEGLRGRREDKRSKGQCKRQTRGKRRQGSERQTEDKKEDVQNVCVCVRVVYMYTHACVFRAFPQNVHDYERLHL